MDVIAPDELDLSHYVRAGDTVAWGQACAEPLTLTERLMRQRAGIGPFSCFLGIPATDTVRTDHADMVSFVSYTGSGGNRALHRAGKLDVLPAPYSSLPGLLTTGPVRADVVLIQLPPADEHGRHSPGLADDYLSAALHTARVVIAEVNDQVPQTCGSRTLGAADLDVVIHTSRPPAEIRPAVSDVVTAQVAARVAGLVEDGVTLQFGVGGLPEAVLGLLTDRRDLGIHSGLINDAAMDLIEGEW